MSFRISPALFVSAFMIVFMSAPAARGQFLDFEKPPIDYHKASSHDPIVRLQKRIDRGEVKLDHDEQFGYLLSVLRALEVPESSQVLVFSKTSFQLRKISPRRPRAIYFNDDTYIGYVQRGDVLEISTTDSVLGGVYYTLDQVRADRPAFVRDGGQCLSCHASSRTKNVPGHLVRSVYAARSGQPAFGAGTLLSDHTSEFSDRFGGWYVTGTHGAMRHMGNVQLPSVRSERRLNREAGANVTDLSEMIDTERYVRPTSDLVALMVLQHQTQMHNVLTFASMEAKVALKANAAITQSIGKSPDKLTDSTRRRIEAAGELVLDFLLWRNEFVLDDAVTGTSGFTEDFSRRGPVDGAGRSLFQLDLRRRMMKYPCSWLVYGDTFRGLPGPMFEYLSGRLKEILQGEDTSGRYAHLSTDQREGIWSILSQTHKELAAAWK